MLVVDWGTLECSGGYKAYISFPGIFFLLCSHFCSFIHGCSGFWGWDLGYLGDFQLMGFGACGVGPSGFSGVGTLYINIEK